ncbi:MAG: peptidoglycan bridge formation glycyltransferase FemA/FemB family protein [Oscillospiraceae bacterium]
MAYKILEKSEYNEYEGFVKSHLHGNFMQSLNWAKVKNNWLFEVVVALDDEKKIKGAMLVLILPDAKKDGKALLYAPRGPVCDYDDESTLTDLVNGAKELCARYPMGSFKIDPYILETDEKLINVFKNLGLNFTENAPFHASIQPRHNYMLCNLRGKTHEDLLLQFGRKTRYYVKMPFERGITCEYGGIEKLEEFYKIYKETGDRQEFAIRPMSYLEDFINAYGEDIRVYIAYFEGVPLAGAVTVNYGGKTAYVYGSSTNEHRELYPTYALQWEMIKWAIDTNCDIYDMQGICIDPEESEQLYSVYQFKKKFAGEVVSLAGEFTFDF